MVRHEQAARAGTQGGPDRSAAGHRQLHPHYSRREMPGQPRPRHGRLHGTVWYKVVRRSVHQLTSPPAWAVDWADLEAAEASGAQTLVLEEQEGRRTYSVALRLFHSHGRTIDRGFGAQAALALEHWYVDGTPAQMTMAGVPA